MSARSRRAPAARDPRPGIRRNARPRALYQSGRSGSFALVRTLIALALVLAACGRSSDAGPADDHDASSTLARRGPDAVLLRVPRAGGEAVAYAFPVVDSALWLSAEQLPAIERVLGFDPEAGTVTFLGTRGAPSRLDLRVGGVATAAQARLTSLSTADGAALFGVDQRGVVNRLTPSGTWRWQPPSPASEVFPQPDGALIVAAPTNDSTTTLWRIFPPDTTRVAEATLPRTANATSAQAGDRIYYAIGARLVGVRARDLLTLPSVELDTTVRTMVPTPSGDRLYILADSAAEVMVFDRYQEGMTDPIELPDTASDLRMDPLGRLLLARNAAGDSIWVIAVGTHQLIGALESRWRADLPAVAPDGSIAIVRGNDVLLADAASARDPRRLVGGARDLWHFLFWNGFRPRASGIDDPVTFAGVGPVDSLGNLLPPDSTFGAGTDSLGGSGLFPATDTLAPTGRQFEQPRGPGGLVEPGTRAFTVQFAALMVEEAARELASHILVDGQRARVVPAVQAGTPVYRVVRGPYDSREAAERAGSRAGRVFWVYEGRP